jgi:hypothetical protein
MKLKNEHDDILIQVLLHLMIVLSLFDKIEHMCYNISAARDVRWQRSRSISSPPGDFVPGGYFLDGWSLKEAGAFVPRNLHFK